MTFYITPAYHAWDPTSVVFFSFSLFFAMIVADAGYGMVMAIGLALGWRKLGRVRVDGAHAQSVGRNRGGNDPLWRVGRKLFRDRTDARFLARPATDSH